MAAGDHPYDHHCPCYPQAWPTHDLPAVRMTKEEIEAPERQRRWDAFAAAALTGLLAANQGIGVVALSRELADAMLAEADKREGRA